MRPSIPSLLDLVLTQKRACKNLFITGRPGSGKTTLFNALAATKQNFLPLLRTAWQGDELIVTAPDGRQDLLARRGPDGVHPLPERFANLPLRVLKETLLDPSPFHVYGIDEIGWMEKNCPPYLETLHQLFKKADTICTLRKEGHALKTPFPFTHPWGLIDLDSHLGTTEEHPATSDKN